MQKRAAAAWQRLLEASDIAAGNTVAGQHQIVRDGDGIAHMAVTSRDIQHGMGHARRAQQRHLLAAQQHMALALLPAGAKAAVAVGKRAIGRAGINDSYVRIPAQQGVAIADWPFFKRRTVQTAACSAATGVPPPTPVRPEPRRTASSRYWGTSAVWVAAI